MNKNTSISIGDYFDEFIQSKISAGRYKNVSEVVRAGLRLLEEKENKVIVLRSAIQEFNEHKLLTEFKIKFITQRMTESLEVFRKFNVPTTFQPFNSNGGIHNGTTSLCPATSR